LYERTPKAVAARVQKIFDSLKTHPIPVVTGDGPADYGVVDYVKVRRTVLNFLYSPFAIGGQALAGILAALEKGDGVPYYAAHIDRRNYLQCQSDESIRQDNAGFGQFATIAIGCSDGDQVNDTLPQLQKWFEGNKKQSSFAELWLSSCLTSENRGWKIRPAEKFKGPFGRTNTSFPLLVIGNTADPVTPLPSAKKMSKHFKGSVLLTVDTPGVSRSFPIATPSQVDARV
jgi:hypothetical protein